MLTARQKEILARSANGERMKQIADALRSNLDAVNSERFRIRQTLQAKNMPHAIAIAFRRGIIE